MRVPAAIFVLTLALACSGATPASSQPTQAGPSKFSEKLTLTRSQQIDGYG
jgi:hypothetical protein